MRSPERRTQTRFLFRFAFPTAATAADKSSVRVRARDSDVTFWNIDFCDIAEILSEQGWANLGGGGGTMGLKLSKWPQGLCW